MPFAVLFFAKFYVRCFYFSQFSVFATLSFANLSFTIMHFRYYIFCAFFSLKNPFAVMLFAQWTLYPNFNNKFFKNTIFRLKVLFWNSQQLYVLIHNKIKLMLCLILCTSTASLLSFETQMNMNMWNSFELFFLLTHLSFFLDDQFVTLLTLVLLQAVFLCGINDCEIFKNER